jgi:glycine/D-amino acid oxidase-like deaminating enzyme
MYEIIIIGGGMSGISVGHFFRDHSIQILERGELLSGASGNNAGFIVSGFGEHFARTADRWGVKRACEIQNIHLNNHRRIRDLAGGLNCDYQSTGSLSVALDEKEEMDLRKSCELLRSQGYPVEWMEQPPVGLAACRGAVFNPADASMDAVSFWSRLAADLPIVSRCEVLEVKEQGGVQVVSTNRGTYEAAKVIFCLNAFAANLVPELSGRYIPLRGQMLELPLRQPPPSFCPILTGYGDIYWRFRGKSLLFGGLESLATEEEVGVATHASQRITDLQLEWIRSNFCSELFENYVPARTWCSTMAFTVDGFPFVGPLPRKNQYVLSGLCGLGHGYAMECASWLFDLITKERDVIPSTISSVRIGSLPVFTGGNWRKLYEAWNH